MSSWYDQFAFRHEEIGNHFRPPGWFTFAVPMSRIPGAELVAEDLWITADGFFVQGRRDFLLSTSEHLHYDEPVASLLFYAQSLEAVQWHRHILKSRPVLRSIASPPPGFPHLAYGDWISKFEHSESGSYRLGDGSGAWVDKAVIVGRLTACFLSPHEDREEFPYLFEVRSPMPS